jgi:hypothetical protein
MLPVIIDPSTAPVNQTYQALIVLEAGVGRPGPSSERLGDNAPLPRGYREARSAASQPDRQTGIAMITSGTTTTIMIDVGTMIAIGGRTSPATHRGATNGLRRGGCVEIDVICSYLLNKARGVSDSVLSRKCCRSPSARSTH